MNPDKRIWFLWLQGIQNAPSLVQTCLNSWRYWNPEWDIEVLDHDRLLSVLPEYASNAERWIQLPAASLSDLVRLNLLARYGGVWTDATCLCRKPLDAWLPGLFTGDFFAFADADPAAGRPIASWFLAATPSSVLLTRWRDDANAYWDRGGQRELVTIDQLLNDPRYAAHATDHDLWFDPQRQELNTVFPYFWVHYLFARLLRRPELGRLWQAVPKLTADIPHRLQHLGLGRKINPALIQEFHGGIAPLYKLTYRHDLDENDRRTLLGYSLDPSNWHQEGSCENHGSMPGERMRRLTRASRSRTGTEGLVRIGYVSRVGASTSELQPLLTALRWVLEHHPSARLCILGDLDLDLSTLPTAQVERATLEQHGDLSTELARLDIHLLPLPLRQDGAAEDSRPFISAALAGVPSIAVDNPAYRALIQPGRNGLLASSPEDWQQKLELLLQAPTWRHALGQAAADHCRQHFHSDRLAAELCANLHDLETSPRLLFGTTASAGNREKSR